jgi:autotransporter-associated beta strand protein
VISGQGALAKTGNGTLELTNGNTYTGGTTLNTGTIKLSGSGALAAGTVSIGGGTLSISNSANEQRR